LTFRVSVGLYLSGKHKNFGVTLELNKQFGGECKSHVLSSYTQCRYSETVWVNILRFDVVAFQYISVPVVSEFLRTSSSLERVTVMSCW